MFLHQRRDQGFGREVLVRHVLLESLASIEIHFDFLPTLTTFILLLQDLSRDLEVRVERVHLVVWLGPDELLRVDDLFFDQWEQKV